MDEQQHEQLVLTAEERAGCARVAAGEGPHSQRAQAVLALADGATLAEAAAQAGLTENQVKHWQGRFRNGRVTIFPEELLAVVAETAVTASTPDPDPVAVELPPEIAPAKEKKEKKAKKGKKKEGDKKKKKDKGKKDKKDKDKKGKKGKDKKGKGKKGKSEKK